MTPSGPALGGAQRRRALADAYLRSRAPDQRVATRAPDRAALWRARRARADARAGVLPRRRVVLSGADAGDRDPLLSRPSAARRARAESDARCRRRRPRRVPAAPPA